MQLRPFPVALVDFLSLPPSVSDRRGTSLESVNDDELSEGAISRVLTGKVSFNTAGFEGRRQLLERMSALEESLKTNRFVLFSAGIRLCVDVS